jgi:DNA-binding MarR family transcriptional regulator
LIAEIFSGYTLGPVSADSTQPTPGLAGDKAPKSLAFLLSQVGIFASAKFADAIEEIGLHPAWFRVLNVIDAAEGSSQHAIGEAIQAPPSRMVAIIDDLETRGLVERRPQPGDRRVRALFLTKEGRKVLERGRKVAADHEDRIAASLSKGEREKLVGLLRKIAETSELGAGVHPGISFLKPESR